MSLKMPFAQMNKPFLGRKSYGFKKHIAFLPESEIYDIYFQGVCE